MTTRTHSTIKALLVDPALFTGPYDANLSFGLIESNVDVKWASRSLRRDEDSEIPQALVRPIYYPGIQESSKGQSKITQIRKGISHLASGRRLLQWISEGSFDVVHFQWTVLPLYDIILIRQISRSLPVILTVHDTEPFNGSPSSRIQKAGFLQAIKAASQVVVHRETTRADLIRQGVDQLRITVIPHGPLSLSKQRSPKRTPIVESGARWQIVLFGKLQPYKGVDILIGALSQLSESDRARLKVIVAGESLMSLNEINTKIKTLGLDNTIEIREGRLSDTEMDELFQNTNCFVFPYRHIEASGVLHLVWEYNVWTIASDLGAFRDLITNNSDGELIEVGNEKALAGAIVRSIGKTPDLTTRKVPSSWKSIGQKTRGLYERAIEDRKVVVGLK